MIFHTKTYRGSNAAFVCGLFVAILLSFSPAISQKPLSKNAQELIVWQQRVGELTDGILQDSKSLDDCEKAFYLALLAKITWKSDPDEARKNLKKAADLMLSDLDALDKSTLLKKLKYTARTIEFIAELDEKLSLSVIGRLEKILGGEDDDASKKPNPELAELFVKIGRQVVETNPGMAMAAGSDSLIYGLATGLSSLIAELNVKDPEKGGILLRQAMAKIQGDYSVSSVGFEMGIGRYMFNMYGPKGFTEPTRRAFLVNYVDRVAFAAQIESERPARCRIASYVIPEILARIDEYMPERSMTFRQNVQACTPHISPLFQEQTRARTGNDRPKSVDDMVRAAKNERDIQLKVTYWREALAILEKEKKYVETISLLESVDGDDFKKVSPIGWDMWRIDSAFQAVMIANKAKDLPAMYRIVEKTPKRIRPDVRLLIAKELKPDNQFFLENLDEMQKEIGTIEQADKDAANFYRELSELYLRVRRIESEVMFRKAVKYINKADSDNPDFLTDKDWAPFEDYLPMSWEQLEADDFSITSSLNSLNSRRSRVRLKLGLLESSLQKLAEVTKKVEAESKKTNRGN